MISFSSEQSILEAAPQKLKLFFLKKIHIIREEYVMLVKLFLRISLKSLVTPM